MLFSTVFLTTRFPDFNGSKILLPALWHCLENPVLSPPFWNNYTGSLSLNESSSSWCSLSTKLLMARLPTIFLNCFKFTLHQGIFDQVLCFSSLNPSLDTHGVTGLFLQPRHASGTLYHLIFDLVFVPQNSSLFSKLILCHRFSMTNFVVSVFLCVVFCFCFVFGFTAPWTPSRVDMCALQVLLLLLLLLLLISSGGKTSIMQFLHFETPKIVVICKTWCVYNRMPFRCFETLWIPSKRSL